MIISKEQFLENVEYHARATTSWEGIKAQEATKFVVVPLDSELDALHKKSMIQYREFCQTMIDLGNACKRKLEQL